MIRGPRPVEEQDEEAAVQNFLFKVNVSLFVFTIAAIKTGNYLVLFLRFNFESF